MEGARIQAKQILGVPPHWPFVETRGRASLQMANAGSAWFWAYLWSVLTAPCEYARERLRLAAVTSVPAATRHLPNANTNQMRCPFVSLKSVGYFIVFG
jgi:hypothetical protein